MEWLKMQTNASAEPAVPFGGAPPPPPRGLSTAIYILDRVLYAAAGKARTRSRTAYD